MFRAGAVDGQDVVSSVQCSTPGQRRGKEDNGSERLFPGYPLRRSSAQHVPHLSTTLAGLMRSMVMTGLFRWEPAVSEIPRADPGVLVISTIRGPEALATVSGTWDEGRV